MAFQLKVIKARKMNIKAFRDVIFRELKAQGKATEKEFDKTVATWSGDKPSFESITDITKGDASVLTGPTGSTKALRKFKYLDEGTAIRWALMSSDWKSKTKPGKLKSGRGKGRPVLIGRRAMQKRNIPPRPGIEAREWTPLIQKRRKPKFTRGMVSAMQRGSKRLYG